MNFEDLFKTFDENHTEEVDRYAIRKIYIKASNGNPQFQITIGDWYYNAGSNSNGENRSRWIKEAIRWFKLVADQGNPKAQCKLADCYKNYGAYGDRYVYEDDYEEALALYRKSADQGDPDAAYALGLCYLYPRYGLKRDDSESAYWFQKALDGYKKLAEEGKKDKAVDPYVYMQLVKMYDTDGYGGMHDVDIAFEYYTIALYTATALAVTLPQYLDLLAELMRKGDQEEDARTLNRKAREWYLRTALTLDRLEKQHRDLEAAEKKMEAEAGRSAKATSENKKWEAERKAREEAARKAEAERKAREEEARRKAKEEAARKAEAERKAREEEARRKAKEEAARKAEAERKAREEAVRKAEAERKAREEEARRKARKEAESARRAAEEKASREIEFGRFPVGLENEIQPIQWIVLRREGDRQLIISKYSIKKEYFNNDIYETSWAECSLRKWLNEDFIDTAFTEAEQKKIAITKVTTTQNRKYGTGGCCPVNDAIFLLSFDEANKYFANDEERICRVDKDRDGGLRWWLRSPGFYETESMIVDNDGKVVDDGLFTGNNIYTGAYVRPAMWINLTSDVPGSAYRMRTSGNTDKKSRDKVPSKHVTRKEITFGRYPQGEKGEEKPIEWLILKEEGDRRLIISKYVLDCKKYENKGVSTTWADCSLRSWLNSSARGILHQKEGFLHRAFTPDEQKQIKETIIHTADNEEFHTSGGADAADKVFLLSIEDMAKYFPESRVAGKCLPTAYAVKKGVYVSVKEGNSCTWWLRSSGYDQFQAANVHPVGFIDGMGSPANDTSNGIRPAMWI